MKVALHPMWLPHILLALGWIAYCCLHSILVTRNVKANLKSAMGNSSRYYRLGYSIFSFGGLFFLIAWQYSTPSILLWIPSLWSLVPGAIVTTCGFLLMLLCLQKYFSSHTGLKELIFENQNPVLLIIGLHRFVRHPLYLSTFIFIWGLFIIFPYLSFFISNLIITSYTLIGIRFEEKKLLNIFGEAYRQYREDVPMIIPRMGRNVKHEA